MNRLRRFVDFCLCLYYFPHVLPVVRLCSVRGLHSMVEKVFLYIIARDIPVSGDVLEIGSYAGASSVILARANESSPKKGMLWLIEPDPQPGKEAFLKVFKDQGLDAGIRLIDKTSEDARKELDARFRFIFIDGNHDYEYVKKDILLWQDRLQPGGIIAFHDSQAPSVSQAIDELIRRSRMYTVLGTVSSIVYASKGPYRSAKTIARLNRLNERREQFIAVARRLGLKK